MSTWQSTCEHQSLTQQLCAQIWSLNSQDADVVLKSRNTYAILNSKELLDAGGCNGLSILAPCLPCHLCVTVCCSVLQCVARVSVSPNICVLQCVAVCLYMQLIIDCGSVSPLPFVCDERVKQLWDVFFGLQLHTVDQHVYTHIYIYVHLYANPSTCTYQYTRKNIYTHTHLYQG